MRSKNPAVSKICAWLKSDEQDKKIKNTILYEFNELLYQQIRYLQGLQPNSPFQNMQQYQQFHNIASMLSNMFEMNTPDVQDLGNLMNLNSKLQMSINGETTKTKTLGEHRLYDLILGLKQYDKMQDAGKEHIQNLSDTFL